MKVITGDKFVSFATKTDNICYSGFVSVPEKFHNAPLILGLNSCAEYRYTFASPCFLYERLPVCKASVVLTLTSSCSSVSGLIAVRAAGHYEIR